MRRVVVHPILCTLYPILFLCAHNLHEHALSQAWRPAIVASVSVTALLALTAYVVRDSKRAGLLTTLAAVLFFGYGHVQDLVKGLPGIGSMLARSRPFLVLWTLAGGACVYVLLRTKRDLSHVNAFLNIASIAVLAQPIGTIALYSAKEIWPSGSTPREGDAAERVTPLVSGRAKPDIYYIVLDGYASKSTLESVYDFDNASFLEDLKRLGFRVADQARSNYSLTFLSLASSLNMTYIDDLLGEIEPTSRDRERAYEAIDNNEVVYRPGILGQLRDGNHAAS